MSSAVCINIDGIALPSYTGKAPTVSETFYNSDKTFMSLCDDAVQKAEMIIVSNTDEAEFLNYVECLKNNGYTLISIDKLENNAYASFTDGKGLLYAYYTARKGTVNIIYDPVSVLPSELSLLANKTVNSPEFYMYGLTMKSGVLPQCGDDNAPHIGLLLVVRCADNSIVLVDGGAPYHTRGALG